MKKSDISLVDCKKKIIIIQLINLLLNQYGIVCVVTGKVVISKKSYETYENTVKRPKFMPSFTFSKAFQ